MLRQTFWLSQVLTLSTILSTGACDLGKVTVNTTSKVLVRAQPSMKQEADFDLAARAIPGTLKTIEGFHMVDPSNERMKRILAEGFCQYATGFVEDEYELALIAGDLDGADHQARRATKSYVRCMGYSLDLLGKKWKEGLLGDLAGVEKMAGSAGKGSRDAMLWLGIGLAGSINYNKDDIALVAQLAKARTILENVVRIDDAKGKKDLALRALPHVALGTMHVSLSKALGGKPAESKKHYDRAVEITEGKFLLAKVYMARRYAVAVQDRGLFVKTLVEVLQTDPAIWPDQRLANEIAHRRARRYLKQEKEWF